MVEQERRANPRFACDLEAKLAVFDGEPATRRVVDIGRGGISLVGPDPVPIGTHVTLELAATTGDGEREALDISGTVVWCTQMKDGAYQLGAKFDDARGKDRARRLDRVLALLRG